MSPLLFAVAKELLAIVMCNNQQIAGVWRGGIEHKVLLYADYLLLYLSKLAISLPATLELLELFRKFSGYKLNLNKSELFPINKEVLKLHYTDIPLKLAEDSFKYLGVCITRELKNLFRSNFSVLL